MAKLSVLVTSRFSLDACLRVTRKGFLSPICTALSELRSGCDPGRVRSETLNEARLSSPLGASLQRPPGPSNSGGTGGGGGVLWTGSLACRPCTPPQPLPPGKASPPGVAVRSPGAPAVVSSPPGPSRPAGGPALPALSHPAASLRSRPSTCQLLRSAGLSHLSRVDRWHRAGCMGRIIVFIELLPMGVQRPHVSEWG